MIVAAPVKVGEVLRFEGPLGSFHLQDTAKPAVFVASGTDFAAVSHEAGLLDVAAFFGTEINAPRDDDPSFTKAAVIERVLRECNGNVSKAARVLGMHRRTLQYKLAKFPVQR